MGGTTIFKQAMSYAKTLDLALALGAYIIDTLLEMRLSRLPRGLREPISYDMVPTCAPECAMGYLNDPFTLDNCFFQPDPSNPVVFLFIFA